MENAVLIPVSAKPRRTVFWSSSMVATGVREWLYITVVVPDSIICMAVYTVIK